MLLKLSRLFLYAAPLAIVIVMPSTFFPFIGGKYYFFRVCVEFAFIFYVLYWAFQAKSGEVEARVKEVFSKPLAIAISIFSLVFLLASLLAYDPHAAFWSNYERGDGGFQMLHYYLFFILLFFLFVLSALVCFVLFLRLFLLGSFLVLISSTKSLNVNPGFDISELFIIFIKDASALNSLILTTSSLSYFSRIYL